MIGDQESAWRDCLADIGADELRQQITTAGACLDMGLSDVASAALRGNVAGILWALLAPLGEARSGLGGAAWLE